MKRIFIILFLSLVIYNNAFTQGENDILKNEWSVNINFIINDVLLSKNADENIIDYQAPIESIVTYRRYFNKNFVWQVGVNFYTKKSKEDFTTGSSGIQSQSKKGYYLRTGFQKYFHLSNQVKFYFGSDLLLSFQKFNASIDLSEVTLPIGFGNSYSHINREKEIGLVPHLGFRWELNSRISFSTETNLVASYIHFDLDLDSPFSSEPIVIGNLNTMQKDSEKFSMRFQQPIVLLINLRF